MFDEKLKLHSRSKTSRSHHQYLYDQLSHLISPEAEKKGKTSAAVQALHEIAEDTHRRSLVVIFSDMMDDTGTEGQEDLFNALQHLRHNKHEVVLFHVIDKQTELDFDFDNRPHTFVDPETGEEVKVQPNDIRDAYKKASSAFYEELKTRCTQYQIDFVPADIRDGFSDILAQYLIKRRKMR